ncbi:helix-turn-helix domain-containing protein [Clostridium felsineum]|uniref:helix-turn-helix domain-containing protein n=1 Tax=Clostridium felsineum TaxID=36839 RepID=UPI00214DEE11|nr:helix-turn-helix transcriptional regulator [Clostridium felsineum]
MTLKDMRIQKGLTASYVAMKLGISHRHFSRIEAGEGYLTDDRIETLSKLYKTKKSEIKKVVIENGRSN